MTDRPDPRSAPDLQTAAQNDDGTYSLPRAMSWLSEQLRPGKGLSEAEVRAEINAAHERHRKAQIAAPATWAEQRAAAGTGRDGPA